MADIIVVGVDGSETANAAARVAADLAAKTGSALRVITAYSKVDGEELAVGSDRYYFSSADTAQQVAAEVARSLTGVVADVSGDSALGKPHDVLIAEAKRLDARLIVVGNRRMQGIGRVLGSVANSIAHEAPCDVYIVKTV